ncbi:MAG: hypothetical protein EOP48_06480 [Sphingobacteriales bacterium]|nr:MAG: hypothetical protein EOP48_06480 [Sphingobacteriales bacterium]
MIAVSTVKDYARLVNDIADIKNQKNLQKYLDTLESANSNILELFWLFLYEELELRDDYNCIEDAQYFWKECREEIPELLFFQSAPNPAIRYAKVYCYFKKEEADLYLPADQMPDRYKAALSVDDSLTSRTFSSPLPLDTQKSVYQYLVKKEIIASTNEETFLKAFSKVPSKRMTEQIIWQPNGGGKNFNRILFTLLQLMCPDEYLSLRIKKEYFLKIRDCFDLSLGGVKGSPTADSLKSDYHKWRAAFFIKGRISDELLDEQSFNLLNSELKNSV